MWLTVFLTCLLVTAHGTKVSLESTCNDVAGLSIGVTTHVKFALYIPTDSTIDHHAESLNETCSP